MTIGINSIGVNNFTIPGAIQAIRNEPGNVVMRANQGILSKNINITGADQKTGEVMKQHTASSQKTLKSYFGKALGISLGIVRAIGCILWSPITFLKYAYYSMRYLDNNQNVLAPNAKKAWKLALTCGVWSPLEGFRKTCAYFESWGSNEISCPETKHFMTEDKKIVKNAVEQIKLNERQEARARAQNARNSSRLNSACAELGAHCCVGCLHVCCAALCGR